MLATKAPWAVRCSKAHSLAWKLPLREWRSSEDKANAPSIFLRGEVQRPQLELAIGKVKCKRLLNCWSQSRRGTYNGRFHVASKNLPRILRCGTYLNTNNLKTYTRLWPDRVVDINSENFVLILGVIDQYHLENILYSSKWFDALFLEYCGKSLKWFWPCRVVSSPCIHFTTLLKIIE